MEETLSMSRRNFLRGAGAVGLSAAVGAGLAGCAPTDKSDPASVESGANGKIAGQDVPTVEHPIAEIADWSWETVPDPIPDNQISETKECDVLVIGAGWAGLCAAVSAAEKGASVIISEKIDQCVGRGGHIAAFGSKTVKKFASEGYFEEADYAELTRRLIMWCHGRVKEPLHWEFARKSGACMDWLVDVMAKHGLKVSMWNGYYKGPDYTEVPVTHVFYSDDTDWVYLDGVSKGLGQAVTVPALVDECAELGVEILYETPGERLLRDGDGPVTGALLKKKDDTYMQVNAKSVILTSGDYLDDDEMRTRYAPFSWTADTRLYLPVGINTGDMHKAAMWVGAAMQQFEPHALTIHLESGAQSYNFLHVNAEGNRFMNEDVNTQSKSCAKALQPDGGKTFTIYDANSLQQFAKACENGLAGGISSDQQYRVMGHEFDMDVELQLRQAKIDQGLLFQADTLDELAEQAGLPADALKATVARYNELCELGQDLDYGKRPELMWPVAEPPFFAGQLVSTLIMAYGGLRTDVDARVLDENRNPIPGLYCAGITAGEYYAEEYPTIVPGNSLGRGLTFGRIAGINAAGGDAQKEIPDLDIPISGCDGPCSVRDAKSQMGPKPEHAF